MSTQLRILGRRSESAPIDFSYKDVRFNQDTLHVFAGLNAVDTREYVEATFKALQAAGQVTSRMGAYKPRTNPYSFQGHGRACLPYVFELAGQYGIRIVAMEVTHELKGEGYTFWGGREGAEVDAAKDAREAIKWFREAINFLCEYSISQGYGYKFAMEAKPNEPRGDIYFPSTGSYLGFINTLDHPEMVGVNPEVGHEHMAGLNFYHVVSQAIEANKLFHIDLNDQKGCRFDQDLRFGSESLKGMFFLVKLLEEAYDGPRHFDAHAYRSEDEEGVWDFAAGCMRTYLILKEKAAQFKDDADIQSLLAEIKASDPNFEAVPIKFTPERAQQIKAMDLDRNALAKKKLPYKKLDQLVVDLLLGVR